MQVQRCPRDPTDPRAGVTLKELSRLLSLSSNHVLERVGYLSSLDFMALISDHLRALASLTIQGDSPHEAASPEGSKAHALAPSLAAGVAAALDSLQPRDNRVTAPAASLLDQSGESISNNASINGTSTSDSSAVTSTIPTSNSNLSRAGSGTTNRTSPASVSLQVVCSSLSRTTQLLAAFLDGMTCRVMHSSVAGQECVRPLLQLLSSPDIITTLIHLTFSPKMRAAAAEESHASSEAAQGCITQLQQMLTSFLGTVCEGTLQHREGGNTIWRGLHNKLGGILTSEQNAIHLKDLVLFFELDRGMYAHILFGPCPSLQCAALHQRFDVCRG
jgi:hypothetical protein